MRVGAGKAPIRFPEAYFPQEGFYGIHDDVCARVLLLEAEQLSVLVSVELPSIRPFALIDALRQEISGKVGADFDRIWFAVTHDLAAPHVPRDETDEKRKLHMEAVEDAVYRALEQALESLRPATVSFCVGYSNVITNRDIESVDGWWVGVDGTGPSDKTLFVVEFSDETNQPIAVIFNYALKSSVMEGARHPDGKKYVTGDLCGEVCRNVEAELHVPTLFFMGAAGDQVPAMKASYFVVDENGSLQEINIGEKGDEILKELGKQLSTDVLKTLRSLNTKEPLKELSHHHLSITLPGQKRYPSDMPKPPVKYYDYPEDVEQEVSVEAIRLNDAIFIDVKPEIMTLTNTELKRKSPFKYTMLFTMVNGGQDYIPCDLDYDRFDYPALHATVARGSDKIFLNEVTAWLKGIYSHKSEKQAAAPVNIACAGGFAFHAKDFAQKLVTYPECRLAAIWDEDKERGQAWAAEVGCRFYEDYDTLLQNKTIAGVVITSEQQAHADLIIRAANAGKHIFVENGLATSNEEAQAIAEAVKRNGIKFVLSDPVQKPPFLYAKQLVDKGTLGTITNARVRITSGSGLAISPKAAASKSQIPFSACLGHHAICLLKWFLGNPTAVACMHTTACGCERAASSVAMFTFESGAIGIAETGNVSAGWPYELQLYGTKGCARVTKHQVQYHLAEGDWVDVPESQWPKAHPYILRYWVQSIINDTPIEMYGIKDAVTYTKMFTAAERAQHNNTKI